MLVNSGITEVVYGEFYRDERIFLAAKQAGVKLRPLKETT